MMRRLRNIHNCPGELQSNSLSRDLEWHSMASAFSQNLYAILTLLAYKPLSKTC